MFKIFKSKKKSKKEKEQKQQQDQEQQQQQQQQQKQRDKSDEKKIKNDDNKENTPSKQQQSQSQVQQQQQQISTDKPIKTSLTNVNDNNNNKIGSSPSSPTSNKTNGLIIRKQDNDLTVDCNYQSPAVETTTATTTNNTNNAAVSTVTNTATNSCQASPSGYSETIHNDSHFHASHLRESQLSGTFSGADLNRILTSGYITGDEDMGYMKRGTIQPKTPKSPHFHRPANFSYSHHPHLVNKKSSKGYLSSTLSSVNTVKKIRHCSNSPTRNSENEEPIRLSKYSGGYVPDPTTPKKIESLDWPSPPYPPAVPELRNRSRSSSSHKTPTKHHRQSEEETEIHDNIDGTTKTQNEQKKIKTYGKVYDDDFNDYLARFRIHSRNSDNYNSVGDNDGDDDDENIDECDNIRQNEKLKREIDEISKLESKSGIAKILAKELKAQEKYVKHASIDPWKASRTPSASIEPVQKTRFESPVNASPSRIYKGSGHHNLSHNSYDDALCSTSAISTLSSTAVKDPLCSTPRKAGTIPKTQVATNIVHNIPVPKPGYTLSSPKSVTLPNSSRYNGMSTHRSVDFDSSGLASGSYYGGHTHEELQNIKSDKKILVNTTNTYKNYNIETRNSHATRSTPNLIGTPKVYTYNELKIGYKKKLPPDVDPERLERHLSPEDFSKIFGIASIEKFYELPEWKRIELKKKAKLF